MATYAVVTHNPEEEFATGKILGVKSAVNPTDAIGKIVKDILGDELSDEITEIKDKFFILKGILALTDSERSDNTIVVWEISAEYPEDNLDLNSYS